MSKLIGHVLEENINEFTRHKQVQQLEQTSAILKPSVDIAACDARCWFGGAPKLPEGMPWPQIDSEDARFVCQIALETLPNDIWSGLGPRSGWLAVFMGREPTHPAVLHFDGELELRHGAGQTDADWVRSLRRDETHLSDHLPFWPVTIEEHRGPLPEACAYRKGYAPGLPDPMKGEAFDLSNPAQHPINAETLSELLHYIKSTLTLSLSRLERAISEQAEVKNIETLTRAIEEMQAIERQFTQIADALRDSQAGFDNTGMTSLFLELATLQQLYVEDAQSVGPSSNLSVHKCSICDAKKVFSGHWRDAYLRQLYRHGVRLWSEGKEIPKPQRDRLKQIWAFDAIHESGFMGHSPIGYIHEPFGPDTPNEVLIELPTSDLVGWIWGDMYTLVLLIKRDDLKQGRFDRVIAKITN